MILFCFSMYKSQRIDPKPIMVTEFYLQHKIQVCTTNHGHKSFFSALQEHYVPYNKKTMSCCLIKRIVINICVCVPTAYIVRPEWASSPIFFLPTAIQIGFREWRFLYIYRRRGEETFLPSVKQVSWSGQQVCLKGSVP
jgi:hypothetical protein